MKASVESGVVKRRFQWLSQIDSVFIHRKQSKKLSNLLKRLRLICPKKSAEWHFLQKALKK